MIYAAITGAICLWFLLMTVKKTWKGKRVRAGPLDQPVLVCGKEVILDVRRLNQGVMIFGAIGSGKSSGPIATLIDSIAAKGFGMLLVAPKPGDAKSYLDICKRRARDDVLVIDATGQQRVNFFRSLLQNSADPATNALLGETGFSTFSEVLNRGESQATEETFWKQAFQRLVRSSLHLLLMAGEQPTPRTILKLVTDVPNTSKGLKDPEWRKGYLCGLLRTAHTNAKQNGWDDDFEAVSDYFMVELVRLSPRTRSVVVAMLTGTSDALTKGIGATIFGKDSTFDLAQTIASNKIIIVDFPLAQWGEVGRFIGAGFKLLVQQEIMRQKRSNPYVIIIDEASQYITETDYEYVSISRGFQGPMILAVQCVEQLNAMYPGDMGRHKANILTGCLATTLVTLPTWETAKFISERCGKEKELYFGGSTSSGGYDSLMDIFNPKPSQTTSSFSQQLVEIIKPEDLQHFRTGGASKVVEAFCLQPGRKFRNGRPWTTITFRQRG